VTERLARAAAARPWRVIAAWSVVIVLSFGAIVSLLGDTLTSEGDVTASTESKRAEDLASRSFPRGPQDFISDIVVVRSASLTVDDPAFRQRVGSLAMQLRRAGAVNATTFYASQEKRLVSADRHATAILVGLPDDAVDPAVADVKAADRASGYDIGITGDQTVGADFDQLSQDDLRTGELFFGLPAALIILVLVFGAVVAGLIPVALAILSIIVALALTALVGQAFDLSVFVVNMITGMGLALGIDYSLFIVSRYREERVGGRVKPDAIGTAGATASRAVLFSGLAFVLAMIGMTLVPDTVLRSLAIGAILVGFVSVVAALTLLPAVLSLLGDRVNALRVPYFGRTVGQQAASESRFWRRIVRGVMRAPTISLTVAVVALLAVASPVLSLRTGATGISTLPDRFPSKQGYVLLQRSFPGQTVYPAQIVVSEAGTPPAKAGIAQLETELRSEPIFGPPTTDTNPAGDVSVLSVPIAGDADSSRAVNAVRHLRSDLIPQAFGPMADHVLVGGESADQADYFDIVDHWLPIVFVFVLGLSFILLTVAFRSVVVPATAIAMNLLSVGAAYGLLVLVFEKGVGNELFRFQQDDTIVAWVPLFLFSVLFGLSMDYQVFLLSRIRERYVETRDNRDSIEFGVSSTARLITGAALIIVAVFAGFARGDLVMFQQMGFGVAVALLIDATVIRSVVVPAAMAVLGRWNWYLPGWLEWLPNVQVEGAHGTLPRVGAPTTEP
jgi:putative drug exporter of the RND superfamily